MNAMLQKPGKTYVQMVAEAKPKEIEFLEAMDRYREKPSNSYLDNQVTRLACRLTGYCDAIADMFGDGYDTVCENVHEVCGRYHGRTSVMADGQKHQL